MRIIIIAIIFFTGCQTITQKEQNQNNEEPKRQRPIAFENGKTFNVLEKKMLFGGKHSLQHFDITDCELKDEQFHYGIGRERFPALLAPEFTTVDVADTILPEYRVHQSRDQRAVAGIGVLVNPLYEGRGAISDPQDDYIDVSQPATLPVATAGRPSGRETSCLGSRISPR